MPIDFMDVMKSKVNHALYSDESMDFTRAYDNMMHLPLSYYIPWEVVCKINKMVTSLKYADKLSYKKKEIINMLYPYGFRKFASGTNRITLSHIEDHSFLIKVALDNVGMRNNPDELVNSNLLKPFMPKVFDVTPCGTIALVERVLPITCLEEANSIASDIFDLIIYHVIGKYVAADIGTKYYMNWGVRYGFGPVILDLTDLFELDGKKLYCNWQLPDGSKCGGEIDYDIGFNNLICNKCHHIYEARQLAKQINNNEGVITVRGGNSMAIRLIVDGKEVARSNNVSESILTRATRRRRPLINKEGRERPTFSGRLVIGDNTATSVTSIERNTTPPKCNVRLITESIEPAITVKEEPVVSDSETTVDTNGTIKTEVVDDSTLPVEEVKKIMDERLEVKAPEQGQTNTEILKDNEIKDRFDNTEDLKENIESITPDDSVSNKITDEIAEEKVSDEEVKEVVNEVFSDSENKEETNVSSEINNKDRFYYGNIYDEVNIWLKNNNMTVEQMINLYYNRKTNEELNLVIKFEEFIVSYVSGNVAIGILQDLYNYNISKDMYNNFKENSRPISDPEFLKKSYEERRQYFMKAIGITDEMNTRDSHQIENNVTVIDASASITSSKETDAFPADIDSFFAEAIKWMYIHNISIDGLKDLYVNSESLTDKEKILINSFNMLTAKYPEFDNMHPVDILDTIVNTDNEYDDVIKEFSKEENSEPSAILTETPVEESSEETFETYGTPDEEEVSTESNSEEAIADEDSDNSEIDAETAAYYQKMINGGEE